MDVNEHETIQHYTFIKKKSRTGTALLLLFCTSQSQRGLQKLA